MSAPAANGTLWIAARCASARAVGPETRVLGLPLVRRLALSAARAGFARVVVGQTGGLDLSRELAGTAALLVAPGDSPPPLEPGRIVVIGGNGVPSVADLARLRAARVSPECPIFFGGAAVVLETSEPAPVASVLARSPSSDELFAELRRRFSEYEEEAADWIDVRSPQDLRAAERRLLQSLVKEDEGFMSRHVERRISLAISRRLASTSVTPNAMTWASVAIGLVGALFFLSNRTALQFTGALVFLLHSILDGCDGELARLKFAESRLGGLIDFWGDNVVHSAVFAAIAIAWSRGSGELWPLGLGAAAIAGTLLSATLVYRETMRTSHEGPLFTSVSKERESRVARLADALARRDFIYLAVILSAFGKVRWFLALAAVGAPLFFVTLAALASGARRAPRTRRSLS